jgi:transcriptional regulator with XRE-family HTH domain
VRTSDTRASTRYNALRAARGITVRKLATVTGIPRASLADYLVGKTKVPAHRLEALERALNGGAR